MNKFDYDNVYSRQNSETINEENLDSIFNFNNYEICLGSEDFIGKTTQIRIDMNGIPANDNDDYCTALENLDNYLYYFQSSDVKGNVNEVEVLLKEVCSSNTNVVLIHPAGNYLQAERSCDAIGGILLTEESFPDYIDNIDEIINDKCISDGALTWVKTADNDFETVGCTIIMTDKKVYTTACVQFLQCTLCLVPPTRYTLYGHDGKAFDYFYYIELYQDRQPWWKGIKSTIENKGNHWLLSSSLHEINLTLHEDFPIGRRYWGSEQNLRLFTLTVCHIWQFSCGNGECIDYNQRCDDIKHCKDETDELNCNKVSLPENYNKEQHPPLDSEQEFPIKIHYYVDVYNLDRINADGATASMDLGVTLTWYDPRVQFNYLKPIIKNYFDCRDVWLPILEVLSGHGRGTYLDANQYEKFCHAWRNEEDIQAPFSDPYMSKSSPSL